MNRIRLKSQEENFKTEEWKLMTNQMNISPLEDQIE